MKYDIDSINKRKKISRNMKKVIDILLVIIIYNIVLVSISCMNKISPISILGYKAYIITTNSMEPKINIGDIIIAKKCAENDLNVRDIITFEQNGEKITHRIVNIEEENSIKKYTTKGDNNNMEDTKKVSYNEIDGKKVIKIPYLGKFIEVLKNEAVFLVIILILLILYFCRMQIQEKKENRREKKKIEETKNKD